MIHGNPSYVGMEDSITKAKTSEYFELGTLPEKFLDVVMREFLPYSVSLNRFVGDDAQSYTSLGTGTFVTRRGKFGILTAHHCLHGVKPEVSIGHGGNNTLVLGLMGSKGFRLMPEDVIEHQLAKPKNESFGPDLTFLEISPEKAGGIRAICSAWPLDRTSTEISAEFGMPGVVLASIGFPELECKTDIKETAVYRTYMHKTFINGIGENDIQAQGEWDYIDSTCDYSGTPDLPLSFGGVSGGAIWSMNLGKDLATGEVKITSSAMVGVTFYQGPLIDGKRKLRGHFIRSIYDVGWSLLGKTE